VVGALIILFDLTFQGLAISLMAGEIAPLPPSRMTVPIIYYLSERRIHAPAETAGYFLELRDSTVATLEKINCKPTLVKPNRGASITGAAPRR